MTYSTYQAPVAAQNPGLLRRIAASVWGAMVFLAEAGPRTRALENLMKLSDEQLAARGTDRAKEITRILGPHAML